METSIRLNWPELVATAIKRRKQQKLTQEQLATICGISKPTLNNFEKGRVSITLESALKVLRALDLA